MGAIGKIIKFTNIGLSLLLVVAGFWVLFSGSFWTDGYSLFSIFAPIFYVLFGLTLLAAEYKKTIFQEYAMFLFTLPGRGIFNIFLASMTWYGVYDTAIGLTLGVIFGWALFGIGVFYILLNYTCKSHAEFSELSQGFLSVDKNGVINSEKEYNRRLREEQEQKQRQQEEEESKRRLQEEEEKRKLQEEEYKKRLQEEEKQKMRLQEENRQKLQEEEQKRKLQDEEQKKKMKEQEEKLRQEMILQEQRRIQEEQQRLQKEQEEKRKSLIENQKQEAERQRIMLIKNDAERKKMLELQELASNKELEAQVATKIHEDDKKYISQLPENQQREIERLTTFSMAGNFEETLKKLNIKSERLTFTLVWDPLVDLDIEVTCPCGSHINYSKKQCTKCGGFLDFDTQSKRDPSRLAFENIYFTKPKAGDYSLKVNYYKGEKKDVSYNICIHEDKKVTRLIPHTHKQEKDSYGHKHTFTL